MNRSDISEAELHAYIDGVLDVGRRREMETIITADPELAARISAYRADMAKLKRLFEPLSERPVPQAWIERARAPQARPSPDWQKYAAVAAALLLVLGATVGWRMWTRGPSDVVEAALQARNPLSVSQRVLTGEPDTDRATYDTALRSALAANIKVPDMTRMGFKFAELRIYSGAAEIVYHDGKSRIFTLYVQRSDGTVRFDQFERNGLRVCVWQDDAIAMVMSGNVSTATMQRMASLAYTGMTM